MTFNEGNNSRNKVLNHLSINYGNNCRTILREIVEKRVRKADKACHLLSKIVSQTARIKNRLRVKKRPKNQNMMLGRFNM